MTTNIPQAYQDMMTDSGRENSIPQAYQDMMTSIVDNDQVNRLIQKYFSQEEWQNAQRVMQAESGGRPDAVGDNYPINGQTIPSVGLFQIRTLPGRPTAQQLTDPEFNVAYAAKMQQTQGWQPWTTARKMGLAGTTPIGN